MPKELRDPARARAQLSLVVLPLEAMRSPLLQKLYTVWNERRGERRFPAKEDITPRDMKDGLKFISLLDVVDGGKDFAYRLRGDGLQQLIHRAYGENLLSKSASEFTGLEQLFDLGHRRVVETGAPRLLEFRLELGGTPVPCRESLYLPLGEDGRPVDHILAISVALPDFDALVQSGAGSSALSRSGTR